MRLLNWRLTLVLLLQLSTFSVLSQNYTSPKWEVFEIGFEAKEKTVKKPFETSFGAKFIHESGLSYNVPGFYNGDKEWLIRFSPEKEGKWEYTTYSSLRSLSGRKGTLRVQKNLAQQHGPIVVNPENPQKFSYADGTPYFLTAFELDWLFALDMHNKDGISKTEKIISHVKENGFNQIVMNVYAFDASWGEREKIKPENNYAAPDMFPYGGSNENPDYTTLNIEFFKHLDRVLGHLNQQQIVAHLMIYVWNKKVNWPEPESAEDNLYFDYVVKRYNAYPNLVWDISKEALAYGRDDMGYITRRIDRLRSTVGHSRLLSVHDYNYCKNFPGKVDFISVQEWRPNLYSAMLTMLKKHSNLPVFNIEHGGYEKTMHSIFDGAYTDPIACLDRNYQCIFAGTYSTYYWQNTSWYNVVTSPFDLPKENQPFFHYYKHIQTLFDRYDFNSLQPFQEAFAPISLKDDKGTYIFYLPQDRKGLYGDLPEIKGKKVKVTWFDPINGAFYEGEAFDMDVKWLGFEKDPRVKGPLAVVIVEAS